MQPSRLATPLSLTASRAVLLAVAAALTVAACSRGPAQSQRDTPPPTGIRYEANLSADGAVPPAVDLKKPKEANADAVAAGGAFFSSMNCDGCHGGGGSGWVGPSLIDGRWRYGGADEEIFSSIYFGRPKGMPAYGGVLGTDGVWMLVAYLKSLPVPGIVPTTSYEEMDRAAATSSTTSGSSAAASGASAASAAAVGSAAPAASAATTTAAAGGTASPVPDSAATPEQMLTKYGCVACHAIDRKVVGPSLNDVAAKYRGHPDAANTLIEKVRSGGAGVWGSTPMIPNPQVPDQDLHTLVKWVLALQ